MKICAKCGKANTEDAQSCLNCGAQLPAPEAPVHNNGGMMAWSIVTLFLCLIPGIVAISQTRKANAALTKADEDAALQKAKIWNIVGCVIGVLAMLGGMLADSGAY